MQQTVAVIVPLLNEIEALPTMLAALSGNGATELILVDGGSTDGSWEWLQQKAGYYSGLRVLSSDACRAMQMNVGAAQAQSDILLFLHADTLLPDGAIEHIEHARWGRFDLAFYDNRSPASNSLKMVEFMINLRSRISGVATGDQAIFVRRDLFNRVGNYDSISIMEDVALSKKLRKVTRPYCSKLKVQTSARRWRKNGVWRTIFLMWGLRLAYVMGVPPKRLQSLYQHIR